MLKRLRIRFAAVIMALVTVMLCLVFGMLYSFTRRSLENESLRMMQSLAAAPIRPSRPELSGGLGPAYLILQIGNRGELLAAGGGYYDLSDEAFLRELIEAVAAAGEQSGVIEAYNLRFYRAGSPEGQRLVFTDLTGEQAALRSLAKNCAILGALCLFLFLGVSIWLSGWMIRPAEKAWVQQRQFVADASHELKTPLTVIMTNAELLQNPEYGAGNRERLAGSILVMSRQMRNLVERLLELARSDHEQENPVCAVLDFSALAENALLPFEALFFEKGLRLTGEICGGVTVQGDERRLRQVLEILLDNAGKYTSPHGAVTVRLERTGRHRCRLSVASTGEAISRADLKNIFKRFYRVDQARSRDGSFGLGLPIAERMVQAHHGRIWAESENGVNTFFVELPVRKEE